MKYQTLFAICLCCLLFGVGKTFAERGTVIDFAVSTGGESPYTLHWPRELAYLGISGGYFTAMKLLLPSSDPLDTADIGKLNKNDINFIDRHAADYHSGRASTVSDRSNFIATFLPACLLLGKKMRRDAVLLFSMYMESYFCYRGIRGTLKIIAKRPRPFAYNPEVSIDKKTERMARESFPSGHATLACTYTTLTAKVFSDYYPESSWKPLVWAGAIGVDITTLIAKYLSGDHFPTDLLAGAAIGAFIGWGVPALHKKRDGRIGLAPVLLQERQGLLLTMNF